MEAYATTKERLIDLVRPEGSLVASLGDEPSRAIAARWTVARPGRVWSVGPQGRVAITAADWRLDGSRIELTIDGSRRLEITTQLRGAWNGENIALATAAALALGIDAEVLRAAWATVTPLPGRLEPVDAGQPFSVFIDYAHTPEALAATLRAVRAMGARRILTVFGCGGDRDRGKRPVMGQLVGELADLAVATTDNPRSEDPQAILAEVEVGLRASGSSSYRIIPDRAEAIRGALATAEPGDVVLIAGKGHESFQLVGDRRLPFSDRDVARATLEGRHGGAVAR
jgi:UDP-N-acetylmuramyl-tripeptide synthetase